MNNELFHQLSASADEFISQLLDVYNSQDWGCNWAEFLEHFTKTMLETVGNWQTEEIDEGE